MAEQIFELCRDYNVPMSVKIKPPTLRFQSQNSTTLVEEINLQFKVQLKNNYFQVVEEGSWVAATTTFVGQLRTPKFPFAAYQLPVSIFNHGDRTLEQYLAWKLGTYQDVINIEFIADQIIQYWVSKVEQEGNSSQFGRIYPLKIKIEFCNYEMINVSQLVSMNLDDGMIPTCDDAIEKMLKRVESIEGRDESCVICMEEINIIIEKEEEEKKKVMIIMEMPCLHVFHEECIKKWLKNSHYCPTCRFPMPTE